MAAGNVTLTTHQSSDPLTHFQTGLLRNLRYWQAYVTGHSQDMAALDQEREQIIAAVSFGLAHPPAWPHILTIIEGFSAYVERQGHWAVWEPVLRQALATAIPRQDTPQIIALSLRLARLAQRQSRVKATVYHYRRVIRLARQVGDQYSEARACSNLGYLFAEQGNWYRSEILCCHALAIFVKIDSDHGRAHTENHLGTLYIRRNAWNKAEYHLQRALTVWHEMKDNHGVMRGLINLGALYNEMERPNQAIQYFEQALQQANLIGEKVEVGMIYLNLGNSYRLDGQLTRAEMFTKKAETLFQKYSNPVGLAFLWSNQGMIYLDQGKWTEARFYFDKALKACRKLNQPYGELKIHTYLIDYELAQGNWSNGKRLLDELEQFIVFYTQAKKTPYLESILTKYRRSLTKQATTK